MTSEKQEKSKAQRVCDAQDRHNVGKDHLIWQFSTDGITLHS